MNFKKFLVAALPGMLLASCASDEPTVGPGGEEAGGKAMYAKIQIQVPSTRSNTIEPDGNTNSDAGYEIGKDYENYIDDVTVVLAIKDDNGAYVPVATGANYNSIASMPDPSKDNVYTILFKDEQIVSLAEQDVYLFAYCNSSIDDSALASVTSLDAMTSSISSDAEKQGIWAPSHFMMVNAPNKGVPSKHLPDEKALRNNYNSAEKALDLGTIDVARTAARFDFRPTEDNIYPIYDANDTEKQNPVANVEIVAMAPLNIAKTFYTLPRVSDDGTDKNWTICGNEGIYNYVVSPFFNEKKTENSANLIASFADKFFASSINNTNYSTDFNYTVINDWYNNATDDNDENWNADNKDGYKIWRYVTENTIPGDEKYQQKGVSTGVVFKAKINPVDNGSLLSKAMLAKKVVYYYNGICYGDIVNLRRVVANLPEGAKMRDDFEQVFAGKDYLGYDLVKDETNHTITRKYHVEDAALQDCTAEDNNSVFKILRPDTDGNYYTYYVYRNRHNDNGNSNLMRNMEFGTVRNNVYKLAVTLVTEFGHTADPKDDYEPEKPEDPDETPKTYFKVSCRVLPWIVRVNNIEF